MCGKYRRLLRRLYHRQRGFIARKRKREPRLYVLEAHAVEHLRVVEIIAVGEQLGDERVCIALNIVERADIIAPNDLFDAVEILFFKLGFLDLVENYPARLFRVGRFALAGGKGVRNLRVVFHAEARIYQSLIVEPGIKVAALAEEHLA